MILLDYFWVNIISILFLGNTFTDRISFPGACFVQASTVLCKIKISKKFNVYWAEPLNGINQVNGKMIAIYLSYLLYVGTRCLFREVQPIVNRLICGFSKKPDVEYICTLCFFQVSWRVVWTAARETVGVPWSVI